MDEKTEELRDIFVDLTDEDTVTETQEEGRGSLAEADRDRNAYLERVVRDMREDEEFDTDLSDRDLVRVVRGYFEGDADAEVAEALSVSRDAVFRARLTLHLVRDRDTDAPFALDRLRELLDEDRPTAEIAEMLEVSPSTVRRYRRVVEAEDAARRASKRYRSAFADAYPDSELAAQHTEDVREDGLEDATEGMETDVSM